MDDKSNDLSISMIVSVEEQESIQSRTIANSKKREKKGVFKKDWTLYKEILSWLQAVKNDCKQACCKACLRTLRNRTLFTMKIFMLMAIADAYNKCAIAWSKILFEL